MNSAYLVWCIWLLQCVCATFYITILAWGWTWLPTTSQSLYFERLHTYVCSMLLHYCIFLGKTSWDITFADVLSQSTAKSFWVTQCKIYKCFDKWIGCCEWMRFHDDWVLHRPCNKYIYKIDLQIYRYQPLNGALLSVGDIVSTKLFI